MAPQITQNQEWTGGKVDNFYDSKSVVSSFLEALHFYIPS